MTGAAFFLIAAGQSLGLTRRVQIGQGLGEDKLDSVRGLVLKVVISSLFFQVLGTIIFFILFNLNFDNSLKASSRGTVVVELQPIDIFSDMGAYMFARDFMRERGYRIALDGLNHQILQFIDREHLGFDLLKLFWSPEMADDNSGTRLAELKEHVDRCGRARLIVACLLYTSPSPRD